MDSSVVTKNDKRIIVSKYLSKYTGDFLQLNIV